MGARTTAILELTWDRVDFKNKLIDFNRLKTESDILHKKTEKGRAIVEIGQIAEIALLEAHSGALTDFVIEFNGKPIKSIKKAFQRTRKMVGLHDVTPHTLRHTAATLAFDTMMFNEDDPEIGLFKISKLLGHKDVNTTKAIYVKYAAKLTSAPARAIERQLESSKFLSQEAHRN